jgi:hypothetical protein
LTEQPKLRGDHHERWEHIARELGDYNLVNTGTASWMRREMSDLCVSEWVEAEAAGKAIEARDKRIAELEAQRDALLDVALSVKRSHKGSIGSIGNVYCAQLDVKRVDAAVAKARGEEVGRD